MIHGRAAREQRPDEAGGGEVAEDLAGADERGGHGAVGRRLDAAAVDGEDRLHRVDEAAEARDLVGRQHEQDGEDRRAVEQERPDRGAHHGERHIALGVLHLIAGGVGELEADVVEEQHRDRRDEDAPGGLELARGNPVHAVWRPRRSRRSR